MVNRFPLTPIPEPSPNTRTVLLDPAKGTVFFTGPDLRDPYWCCGKCEETLAVHGSRIKLGDCVLKCSACGTFNDTRPTG